MRLRDCCDRFLVRSEMIRPSRDLDQPVGLFGNFARMGNDDDRVATLVHAAQERHDFVAALAVERAGRLVRKNDPAAIHQRPGDGDTLLLTAGKLVGTMIEPVAKLQRAKQRLCPVMPVARRRARIDRRDLDVFLRAGRRDEIVALEDEAERAPAQSGKFVGFKAGNMFAVEQIIAARRLVETAENIHQRRLARAGLRQ